MGDPRMPARGGDHDIKVSKLLGGAAEDVTAFSMGFRTYSALDHPFMYVDVTISDQANIIKDVMAGDPCDYSVEIGHRGGDDRSITGRFHIAKVVSVTQTAPKGAQAITFRCKGQEHLLNEQTKYSESRFWWDGTFITEIVKATLRDCFKINPLGNAQSIDNTPVGMPRQHPMQMIAWLNSMALSPTGTHGNFAVYQKFFDGEARYFYDDIPKLLLESQNSWIFKENETGIGNPKTDTRDVDEKYCSGVPVSPILSKATVSFQNASTAVQQGMGKRAFFRQDIKNKEVFNATLDPGADRPFIGRPPMPEVQRYINNVFQQDSQGRVLYEPWIGDETLRPNGGVQAHVAWANGRFLGPKLLSKLIEFKTYGVSAIGPGDLVTLDVPEYDKTGGGNRALDPTNGGVYIVYAVEHQCDRNGFMYSNLIVTRDGTT